MIEYLRYSVDTVPTVVTVPTTYGRWYLQFVHIYQCTFNLLETMHSCFCRFQAVDLTKPIDKRAYRGTSPTCHDFNCVTGSPDSVMIVVGFSAGQVQLIDPLTKELSKLYNEEVYKNI